MQHRSCCCCCCSGTVSKAKRTVRREWHRKKLIGCKEEVQNQSRSTCNTTRYEARPLRNVSGMKLVTNECLGDAHSRRSAGPWVRRPALYFSAACVRRHDCVLVSNRRIILNQSLLLSPTLQCCKVHHTQHAEFSASQQTLAVPEKEESRRRSRSRRRGRGRRRGKRKTHNVVKNFVRIFGKKVFYVSKKKIEDNKKLETRK